MCTETILTIDIGTTNLKCILFDKEGNQLFRESSPNVTYYPRPFYAEQNPEEWVKNLKRVLKKMHQACPEKLRAIDAVVLTGQMHGPVLFSRKAGKATYPCIIWSDTRAGEEVAFLQREFSAELFLEKMGNPLQQSFTLPKLLWLKRHRPEAFREASFVIFPKDYIGCLLGGEPTTDYSDASGSLYYDIRTRCWKRDLWEALGFPQEMLPEVVSGDSVIGHVSEAAGREFFLPSGIPIIKGGGDLATTILATSMGNKERISLCVGTAGQLLLSLDDINENILGKLYVFLHSLGEEYFALGTVPAGGASLQWFLSLFEERSTRNLWIDISGLQKISRQTTLLFYPFLLGTGTPYFDYRTEAAFLGLRMDQKLEDILLAILEGIVFALRDSLDGVAPFVKEVRQVILSGGLARIPLFSQIVSSVFGLPVTLFRYQDTASMGAFLLAMRAMGNRSFENFFRNWFETTCFPEEPYVHYYTGKYSMYRSFLPSVLSFASQFANICGKDVKHGGNNEEFTNTPTCST